jgi:hypothetical protein
MLSNGDAEQSEIGGNMGSNPLRIIMTLIPQLATAMK